MMQKPFFLYIKIILILLFLPAIQPQVFCDEKNMFDLSLTELMNITVATKTAISVEEAPSIVSVVTASEIKNMGARNLVDVLRTIPGIEIDHSVSFWTHEVNVRGIRNSYTSKVKLMLNGHRVYGWLYMFAPFQLFDCISINNIKRIEIIRGPGSALYGAGAFTGVINIITKKGGDEPSSVSIAAGNYGTYHPAAELSYQKNDFHIFMYADHFKTNGYNGDVREDMATNSPVFDSAVPGELTSQQKYTYLHTRVDYKQFHSQYMLSIFNAEVPVGVTRILTDENTSDDITSFLEIGYDMPINSKGNLSVKAFYDYGDSEGMYEVFPEETGQLHNQLVASGNFGPPEIIAGEPWPVGQGLMASPSHQGHSYGGELMVDYELLSSLMLVGGISYEFSKLDEAEHLISYNVTGSPITIDGIYYQPFPYTYLGELKNVTQDYNWIDVEHSKRNVTALYLQGTIDLKQVLALEKGVNNLALTLGARYDEYSDFGSTINPRAGLIYGPNKKLYFKLLYGQAFRAPNFSELYNQNNPTTTGNPDIKAETIDTIEFLVGYNFTDKIRTSATFFDFKIDDVIQRMAADVGGLYENSGSYEGNGIEIELKWLIHNNRYFYYNMTYQDIKDTTNSTITPQQGSPYTQADFNPGSIPHIYGNIGLNYDFTDWMIGNLSIAYTGEVDRSKEMALVNGTLVQADNRDSVNPSTVLNGTITLKDLFEDMEIQLSGYNLLNEDHRSPDPEAKVTYDFPHPGTTFRAVLSYTF